MKWYLDDVSEMSVDLLAEAVAAINPMEYKFGNRMPWRCMFCREIQTSLGPEHTDDCAYAWAVEHTTKRGDQ